MAQVSTRIKTNKEITAHPDTAPGEDALLVAALAATLVEYRRYVKKRNGSRKPETAGPNWRTMSRLEQLRGEQ